MLRFNEVTRQSVSRVQLPRSDSQQPAEAIYSCLAFPYLRTMATAGADSASAHTRVMLARKLEGIVEFSHATHAHVQ